MGAGRLPPRPYYEGGLSPRLEDVGLCNVAEVAASSQEQDPEYPSHPSTVAALGGTFSI